MSCGVGHRHGSYPTLRWLWCRPMATGLIQSLAWEPPYAAGAALKRQKKKKKKKKKKRKRKKEKKRKKKLLRLISTKKFVKEKRRVSLSSGQGSRGPLVANVGAAVTPAQDLVGPGGGSGECK